MGFTKVRGQERAVNLIKAGYKSARVSHAYLFYGPSGVGKSLTALVFAGLLNCTEPTREAEPCGLCSSCRKVLSGNHPDIIRIEPEGNTIKIGQIRAIKEKANYKCYEGKYKVIMIDDVHLLTEEAANSLLKTLEEPPRDTVFILITPNKSALPATILSRCQPVPFSPLAEETIKEILSESGYDVNFPLSLARGSVGKALQLMDKYDGEQLVRNISQMLEDLASYSYQNIFAWAEAMEKDRDMLEISLDIMAMIYRDRMVAQAVHDESLLLGNGEYSYRVLSAEGCAEALKVIADSRRLISGNVNVRLILEVLLIKLKNIECLRKGD